MGGVHACMTAALYPGGYRPASLHDCGALIFYGIQRAWICGATTQQRALCCDSSRPFPCLICPLVLFYIVCDTLLQAAHSTDSSAGDLEIGSL